MDSAAVQRFAILLVLFGGFLEISHVIQDTVIGLTTFGIPIMVLALCIGILGLALDTQIR